MRTPDDILGTGFAFPLLPSGGFATVSGAEGVAQGLRDVLLTHPGERIGRPTYGAGLRRFLFAPNTVGTRSLVQRIVVEALRRDEPRADLRAVRVTSDPQQPTLLWIDVQYTLLQDTTPRNLVHPFYLDDRTG